MHKIYKRNQEYDYIKILKIKKTYPYKSNKQNQKKIQVSFKLKFLHYYH
jgi:hypothetical protein